MNVLYIFAAGEGRAAREMNYGSWAGRTNNLIPTLTLPLKGREPLIVVPEREIVSQPAFHHFVPVKQGTESGMIGKFRIPAFAGMTTFY